MPLKPKSRSPVAIAAALRWDDAGHRIPVKQAYDLRDLAALAAVDLHDSPVPTLQDKALRAQALRNLTNVWSDALERLRIMRNRPLPGSLRPERMSKPRPAQPAKLMSLPIVSDKQAS